MNAGSPLWATVLAVALLGCLILMVRSLIARRYAIAALAALGGVALTFTVPVKTQAITIDLPAPR